MKTLLILFLSFFILFGQKTLDVHDKARKKLENRLAHFEKKSVLFFYNIRNLKELVNGKAEINNKEYSIKNGLLEIPKEDLAGIKSNKVELYFSGKDYLSKKQLLYHIFGLIENPIIYVLDNRIPGSIQIVLNWDNRSGKYDLDSHIEGDGFHVYYRNMKSYSKNKAKIRLYRDVIKDNHFELIEIRKPKLYDQYNYYVVRYSGRSDWLQKRVQVDVYYDNKYVKTIYPDQFNADDDRWNVLSINSAGNLVSYNDE